MNPIEFAFSKLKALLRQNPARTIDALWRRLGTVLDTFTAPNAPTINTQCENALGPGTLPDRTDKRQPPTEN
ncbi:hypothetical protein DF3PB_5960001 [uncultured Defluviicoccus sp.]|uniref:Transposase n=1 Tax=metagenome TaxID=256318 RepID=A0A380TIN3_9ZZZZ|nr:hypothetical protein DF3PB_5960001 [uncultured Defluviicoccus sp.]